MELYNILGFKFIFSYIPLLLDVVDQETEEGRVTRILVVQEIGMTKEIKIVRKTETVGIGRKIAVTKTKNVIRTRSVKEIRKRDAVGIGNAAAIGVEAVKNLPSRRKKHQKKKRAKNIDLSPEGLNLNWKNCLPKKGICAQYFVCNCLNELEPKI